MAPANRNMLGSAWVIYRRSGGDFVDIQGVAAPSLKDTPLNHARPQRTPLVPRGPWRTSCVQEWACFASVLIATLALRMPGT